MAVFLILIYILRGHFNLCVFITHIFSVVHICKYGISAVDSNTFKNSVSLHCSGHIGIQRNVLNVFCMED